MVLLTVPGWIGRDWIAFAGLRSNFGNRQISGYFYDVAPRFRLADRPSYDARAGYMGSDVPLGVLVPVGKRWRVFMGAVWSYYGGSANSTSPLFKRESGLTGVLGLSWTLYESKRASKQEE